MIHYDIKPQDIKGWLYLATPAALGLKLASDEGGEFKIGELGAKLEEAVERLGIDLVVIDPFVKAHAVNENDNNHIDKVATILAAIAVNHDCAVDAPHHTAKGAADPGNADKGRGASAHKDSLRLTYTLNAMTPEEAQTFGIPDADRRSLIRVDSAKVNIVPPATSAKWFRLVGVSLGNGNEDYPNGDEVQTVEPRTPRDVWEGLNHRVCNEILTAIDRGPKEGSRYSDRGAARERAAWQVVVQYAPDKNEKQAREIVRTWVKNGVLVVVDYADPTRREPAKGLKLNPAKRPS